MKENREHFELINPFELYIKYLECDPEDARNNYDLHIHGECEICINLTGDLSFIVENNIYPVSPGDIVITRPHEYHHCIYHSGKIHKHFFILFSAEGNEHIFDMFYKRKAGEGNLLSLPQEFTEELVALCHKMTEKELSQSKKYYYFFNLIHFLENATAKKVSIGERLKDTAFAVNYINTHFGEKLTVAEIAKFANVSVNTLERHFVKELDITPRDYIKRKRLANAAKLLSEGCTVTEASCKSGFSDYSGFISLFKSTYGITPLKYKKSKS